MPYEPHDAGSPARAPDDVPEALRRALVTAAVTHEFEDEALHEAVCEYVRDLRERGFTPESVVIAVKQAVHRSTLGLTPHYVERRDSTILLDRVVRWCIEEYISSGD